MMDVVKKETTVRVLEKFDLLSQETQLFILGIAQGYMLLKEKQQEVEREPA